MSESVRFFNRLLFRWFPISLEGQVFSPPPPYLLTAAHRAPHSTVRTPSFIQQPATNNRQRANGESSLRIMRS